MLAPLQNGFKALRTLFSTRQARAQLDPNTPFALYFAPSGKVSPITLKSMNGWSAGEYNAINASVYNHGNASPTELGFAYISEVNVWVRRCVEIRAQNIARLDWYVEDIATGKRIPDHPLMVAIDRARHFFLRYERSMDIWGEVYLKPLKNDYGYFSDVWWLNNLSVSFNIVNGAIFQFYFVPLHGGKPYVWNTNEVCYTYNENAFDDLHGSSRILAVLQEANVHEEIARSAQAHFANDARPGIMFLPETDLGKDQSQEFLDYWKANFQGSLNTNKPVLLPMQIKSVQVLERASLKDDVELRGSIRREICAGFGVPLSVAGAWDDANYQSAPEQRISLYEDTIIPEADGIAKDLTTSLLPFFDRSRRCRVAYDAKKLLALAEDKQAKATALNSQLVSGGITLNQYREALDQEAIPQGNVFYVPSGVIVTPVEKLGSMPAPQPPSPFGAPTQAAPAPAAPAVDTPPEEPAKASGSMAILLSLANNTDLIALQKRLKELLPDPAIQWTDPATFHVTMIYVPAFDDAQTQELVSYMHDYTTPELNLNVGSLASFDNVGEHALHFRIPRNAALMDCQEELHAACESMGLAMSAYSNPAQYKPHITMGYSPQRIPITRYQSNLRVTPDAMEISIERDSKYDVIWRGTVSPSQPPEPQPEALASKAQPEPEPVPDDTVFMDELDAFEKFTLNRWGQPQRAFRFNVIADPLRAELVAQVAACTGKAQVRKLFEGLREALKKNDDSADFVTPEQAQEWWGEYDRLMKRLGNDWLRDYMREVWRRLQTRLNRDISADDVQTLLADFHPDLIEKWTGTAEEPGVIAKLFMAGMGAGQAALERSRVNLNPNKAAELNIDWNLVPADAIAAVEKYVGRLIKNIDKTTLADVQRILVQWLESGGTLDDLKRQLEPVFNDPARADLIATTESSNAYNNGAVQRWTDAGVSEARWQTVRDALVCPTCEPLHNKTYALDTGIYSDVAGAYLTPPAHPRCRCYSKPVV